MKKIKEKISYEAESVEANSKAIIATLRKAADVAVLLEEDIPTQANFDYIKDKTVSGEVNLAKDLLDEQPPSHDSSAQYGYEFKVELRGDDQVLKILSISFDDKGDFVKVDLFKNGKRELGDDFDSLEGAMRNQVAQAATLISHSLSIAVDEKNKNFGYTVVDSRQAASDLFNDFL